MPKRKAASAEAGCDPDRPPEESPAEHATRGDAPPSPLCFDTPASLFQSLIQPCGSEEFFREHWEKRPLHLRRSDAAVGRYYGSLFRLSDLRGLCGRSLRYARDLNVCRCIGGRKKVLNGAGRVSYAALSRDLARKKATIQLHQPQRFKNELWRIQEKLECFFGSLVGSNVYITPEKSQGLPPHYDDVEVFILQLEGEKHWRLYSPTVPLATEYSLEPESRIGNPTHDILLKAGDLLYLPRGTIHQADTPEGVEHSTHLTLSTYQHMSYGDLLQDAVPSLLWDACRRDQALREGVPRGLLLASSVSAASSRLSALLRGLADDVEAGRLEPRSVAMGRDFVASRLPPYPLGEYGGHGDPQDHLAPAGKVPALEDSVCLRFRDHILIAMEPSQEKTDEATELVVFVLHSLKNQREGHMMGLESSERDATSQGLRFPPSHLQALRQLQVEEKVSVKLLDLPSDEAKRNLALALWSESLLQVC